MSGPGIGQVIQAARAASLVDPAHAYVAIRALLCSSPEEIARFDAFALAAGSTDEPGPEAAADRVGPGPSAGGEPGGDERRRLAWSTVEALVDRDLAELDDRERRAALVLLARLGRRAAPRPSRRREPGPGAGRRPDVRRAMQDTVRLGGEPARVRWRSRGITSRRLTLVLDVSGSMEPYAAAALAYGSGAVGARRSTEVFVLATRLTRVTRELRGVALDDALGEVRRAARDLGGGTCLGDGLTALNRRFAHHVGRGADVVIVSDGWDRGDPERIGCEMARLRKVSRALVWMNPLVAQAGYEPLALGMAAALPHVDRLLAGHSVNAFARLADSLEDARAAGPAVLRSHPPGGCGRRLW